MDYPELMAASLVLHRSASIWQRQAWEKAALELGCDGSTEAAEVLARQYPCSTGWQRDILERALGLLVSEAAVLQAWRCWDEGRDHGLAAALASRPPQLPCSVRLFVRASLKIKQVQRVIERPWRDIVEEVLEATRDKDNDIGSGAFQALTAMADDPLAGETLGAIYVSQPDKVVAESLARITHPDAIRGVCQVWARTRHHGLAQLIQRHDWQPATPADLALLVALKFRRAGKWGTEGQPLNLAPLLLACSDSDLGVRQQAEQRFLGGAGPDWRDAVCEAVLQEDCPASVRRVLADRAWHPAEAQARAVYFLLTDQFDKAEDLDFDLSMLSNAYRHGAPALRRRLAAAIRRSRRPSLSAILMRRAGDDFQHLLLPASEWDMVLAVLDAPERTEELWSLALDAPPHWSVQAVSRLIHYNYRPAEGDLALYRELVEQDMSCLQQVDWSFIESERHPEVEALPCQGPVALHQQTAYVHQGVVLYRQGETVRLPEAQSAPWCLTWDGAGSRLAMCDATSVEVWDVAGPARVRALPVLGVDGLALSADGRRLVTQTASQYRQYWDLESERMLPMREAKRFNQVALNSDGSLMALVRSDEWRLYGVEVERAVDCFRLLRRETMQAGASQAAFSPNNLWLALVSSPGLKIISLVSGEVHHEVSGDVSHPVWSADGHWLAIEHIPHRTRGARRAGAAADPRIQVVNVSTRLEVVSFTFPLAYRQAKTYQTRSLWFSPDGQFLTACTYSGKLLRWHLCPTPLAGLQHLMRGRTPDDPAWAFLSALLKYRRRYDIEIEEIAFIPDAFDIELET